MSIKDNKKAVLFFLQGGLVGSIVSILAVLKIFPQTPFGVIHVVSGVLVGIVAGWFTYVNRKSINELTEEQSEKNVTILKNLLFRKK